MKTTVEERFYGRVEKTDGECVVFTGSQSTSGYGQIYASGGNIGAHRLAWELSRGEIPTGMLVLHNPEVCSQRKDCVNVDHLKLGDHRENSIDSVMSGKQGLKLSAGNVVCIRKMLGIDLLRKEIAQTFGVTVGNIGAIATGRSWAWV